MFISTGFFLFLGLGLQCQEPATEVRDRKSRKVLLGVLARVLREFGVLLGVLLMKRVLGEFGVLRGVLPEVLLALPLQQ